MKTIVSSIRGGLGIAGHIMGPKDKSSTTWCLGKVKLRSWGHCRVITKTEGRELKPKKCVKGWARWTPVSEAEKAKFQELVLCPRSDHNDAVPRDADDGEGLVLLHERLVGCCCRGESHHDFVKELEQILCS